MADPEPRFRSHLAWILVVSAALRVGLALQGGQFYFGDEGRMNRGAAAYVGLLKGDGQMVRDAFSWPEHAGFTPVAAVATACQHVLTFFTGQHDWSHGEHYFDSVWLAAAVLGLFSTLNLWLVHRLARAAGADPVEADWAALLAAASAGLFYYSRHLLPYDCSLSAALVGCVFALGQKRGGAFWSGIAAGTCYEVYNGYWFLVPIVAITLVATRTTWRDRYVAGAQWLLGLALVIGALLLPGAIIGGQKYWVVMSSFSRSARQGVFREGWSLPWEYLWHAERWLGVVVVAAIAWVVLRRVRAGAALPFRVCLWLGLAAAVWLQLFLTSTVLEKFVVYARSARALLPFLALLGGYAAAQVLATRARWRLVAVVLVVAAAGLNFLPHFQLVFPAQVRQAVWRDVGTTKEALTFSGASYEPPGRPLTRPDLVLVNAQGLYPLRDYLGYPAGRTLLSLPHIAAFPPYQYEGHTPRERRLLRENEISIRLIRLAAPATVPDTPPRRFLYGPPDYPDGFDRSRP